MGWLERRMEGFVEKQRPKLIEWVQPHLEPGETVAHLVVGNARRNLRGKPAYVVATDRTVRIFEGSVKTEPSYSFPLATAYAALRDDGGIGMNTPVADEHVEDLHEIYVVYPGKGESGTAAEFVAYVAENGRPAT